jgi:hypothetical protein
MLTMYTSLPSVPIFRLFIFCSLFGEPPFMPRCMFPCSRPHPMTVKAALCSTQACEVVSFCLFSFLGWSGVRRVRLVRRPLFGLLYQHRMMDDDECAAVGGMLGSGNRSTRRKPAPVPLCLPQILHGLTQARTQAAAVGSQ